MRLLITILSVCLSLACDDGEVPQNETEDSGEQVAGDAGPDGATDGAPDGAADSLLDGARPDGATLDGQPLDAAADAAPDVPVVDQDGDGVPDDADNCPAAPNPEQRDADDDGLGDACDLGDADGDGLSDRDDPCPADPAETPDTDGDGLGDRCDVCPQAADPDQADADGDGIGDACEIPNDGDADGVPDDRDNCPAVANGDQADRDSDGVGDVCDICPGDVDPEQLDTDGDGMGDGCDVCPDVALVAENHTDRDGDGDPTCAGDCDDANPRRSAGQAELCDEIDNDCDQMIDEGFEDLGEPCGDGVGECRVEGVIRCAFTGESTECSEVPGLGGLELCDDLDNDCDGRVDEDVFGCCEPGDVEPCGIDEGACSMGERECQPDQSWSECDGVGPAEEVCNGVDDDCDGEVDDLPGETVCGRGACRQVLPLCADGAVPECDPFLGAAEEECNGVDDDCDGIIDTPECIDFEMIEYRLYMDAIHLTLGLF